MPKYQLYIVVLMLLSNLNCKDKGVQPEQSLDTTENINNITSKDIDALKFIDYGISNDSKNTIGNWAKYQELDEQTNYLKKGDFSFFNGEKQLLKIFIADLKTGIPESIKTAPILSRITVVETKLLKLNSTLKLDNIDKAIRLKNIKEYLEAFSNLNLQINKKFELEANTVDKNTIED
jgi:hypothetical protein